MWSSMSSLTRRWIFLAAIVASVLIIDQTAKRWVLANLALGESYRPIPALYPLFQLTRSENTGSAFGFLPQAGDIFLIIAVIVVIVMLVVYPRVPEKPRLTRLAMGLVIGGALGNVTDRITHGAVIDFIHYQIPGVISNVSNLADHAIVLGVLIIFVLNWRSDDQKQQEPVSDEQDQP
jgi:signal peptidase II